MKKLVSLFLILCTFLFAETSLTTEKFSLDFQKDFTSEEFSIPTAEKDLHLTIYLGEGQDFSSTLTVAEISKDYLKNYKTNEILENTINTGILQVGGKILETKDITLGTYQGKECKYQINEEEKNYTCYVRAYIVNEEIYVLGTASLNNDKTLVDKFFNSFKIIK